MEGDGHRVLLVDDEEETRDPLRRLLELKGYVVETAANGAEALAAVQRADPPCIVLLDLLMPWMSGWEFCVEMRKHDRLADLPVVVISGMSDRYGDFPGVVAHLRKPIDIQKLYEVIEAYC